MKKNSKKNLKYVESNALSNQLRKIFLDFA